MPIHNAILLDSFGPNDVVYYRRLVYEDVLLLPVVARGTST